MLPIRLEMRNFLAYRSPDPLNLEDLHLACLVGRNGAGKSSLLDAITWALWGKARSRSDDDLIYLGETDMLVSLDFLQGGQKYRVTRKRKSGKARKGGGASPGQSTLDLFAWDDASGAFRLISEPAMRETQQRINTLLHLDHEIFVNSAFLQQGKADAFTTKTPAQRKEILSDILGLERWGLYEEETKAQLHIIQSEIESRTIRLAEIDRELAEEAGIKHELAEAEARQTEAQTAVEAAQARLETVSGADIELRKAQEALITLEFNIREREKDLDSTTEEITRYEDRLAIFQEVLDQQEKISQGYAQLESARVADAELGTKLRDLNDLNQHIAALESALQEARQQIELEQRELQTLIEKDQETVQLAQDVLQEMTQIQTEIESLETLEKERTAQLERITHHTDESAALRGSNESIHAEAEMLKGRIEQLEKATEALCPLCGQALDATQKQDLIDDLSAQVAAYREKYRQNNVRFTEIRAEIKSLQDATENASNQLKDLPRLRNRIGAFEQQISTAETALARMNTNQINYDELATILATGRFGESIRIQLETAYAERDALGYDAETHNTVREQLETFLDYQDKSRELEIAQRQVPADQQSLENALKRRARWQKSLDSLAQQATTQAEEITQLEIKVADMKLKQQELEQKRTQLRNAEEKVITYKQRLNAIDKMRGRRLEILAQREEYQAKQGIYEQLRVAFGRNGVPAMLIDAAIPELEEGANNLLSRMTNNRMHLRFDTQREKKTGGIAETLDIWIQDEIGQRDYSLYSGGEAFRVNFAIRVALSQLLARRAGAQLRTLFIDEGFGTQDDAGRERLVEAINSIQDDFDLILVITHIDDLKDAFPARIEVHKTTNGSVAAVR